MSNHYETDPIAAARDALFQMTAAELEHMLYEVQADHIHAVAEGLDDEPAKLAILQLYEKRAEELGVHVTLR